MVEYDEVVGKKIKEFYYIKFLNKKTSHYILFYYIYSIIYVDTLFIVLRFNNYKI